MWDFSSVYPLNVSVLWSSALGLVFFNLYPFFLEIVTYFHRLKYLLHTSNPPKSIFLVLISLLNFRISYIYLISFWMCPLSTLIGMHHVQMEIIILYSKIDSFPIEPISSYCHHHLPAKRAQILDTIQIFLILFIFCTNPFFSLLHSRAPGPHIL